MLSCYSQLKVFKGNSYHRDSAVNDIKKKNRRQRKNECESVGKDLKSREEEKKYTEIFKCE